ncbi:MAG TPA: hypothetical protein VNC40_12760 [Gaiellaceae bacterium]|nr:hypothetical protein [Gaiellaceae bacterium]
MPGNGHDNATRRITVASALIIALIAAASAVTIWRYQQAVAEHNVALQVRAERLRASEAATAFWREREAANEFLVTGEAGLLAEVVAQRSAFEQATAGLGSDVAAESALVGQALVALRRSWRSCRRTVLRRVVGRRSRVGWLWR